MGLYDFISGTSPMNLHGGRIVCPVNRHHANPSQKLC